MNNPMRRSRAIIALASAAWAAAIVSSATPADATAVTYQSDGSFASCSSNAYASLELWCGNLFETNYRQTIKIGYTSCNTGTCQEHGDVYVDFEYEPGRHTASYQWECNGVYAYGLGTCAC